MGSYCVMSCLLRRCRHANGLNCHSSLRRWSCLGWSRCRFGLHFGPHVPVRVFSQMDSWSYRWSLPVWNHHWYPPLQRLQQRHQKPAESFLVSHPSCNSVHLGRNSCLRHVPSSRGAHFLFLVNNYIASKSPYSQSPRWLIKKHRDADAAHSLSRLTSLPADDPEVTAELDEIRLNLKHEEELGESSYLDCFRASDNRILFRTLTGIFIQAWQQLTGINFIFYFGTTFFTNAGIRNPYLISIATSTVNVGMTLPGIWGVERFGRRRLLLVGAVGMTICEFVIAIIGSTTKTTNQAAQSAEVAFVCFYIAFFASTWGPVTWAVTGEIFPLKIRAKAMSRSVASNWLWNFGIAYASTFFILSEFYNVLTLSIAPYLVDSGPGNLNLGTKVFYVWGSTCFVASSLHTSAFRRRRVFHSNRSTCCTGMWLPSIPSRTASDSWSMVTSSPISGI